jgi:hypothetical protein
VTQSASQATTRANVQYDGKKSKAGKRRQRKRKLLESKNVAKSGKGQQVKPNKKQVLPATQTENSSVASSNHKPMPSGQKTGRQYPMVGSVAPSDTKSESQAYTRASAVTSVSNNDGKQGKGKKRRGRKRKLLESKGQLKPANGNGEKKKQLPNKQASSSVKPKVQLTSKPKDSKVNPQRSGKDVKNKKHKNGANVKTPMSAAQKRRERKRKLQQGFPVKSTK